MDTTTKLGLIECLTEIKLSIVENATDVIFIRNSQTTVCEQLDAMLYQLGVSEETLESQYTLGMKLEDPMGDGDEPTGHP